MTGGCTIGAKIVGDRYLLFKNRALVYEAMRIHKMITPLEDLREGRGSANNVPVIKAVKDSLGLAGGNC